MKHTILPIYYLIFIVFIAICMISHNMFSDGMFMDGLWYAAVSKNMAHGLGSFWYPHFTNTLYSEFHEHPPLVFFLQSLCFRLFGDSFLVERFYSLCMTLTSGFFIYLFWKQINKKDSSNVTGWLPLFLWIAVPVVSWACANNMLENTTTVFTTLAVFCIWKSFQ
ncbi:MAG: glycosyltransferase family 39 protein, partial [Bacteroidia bacterium]|nr:glycosyltransferase family 39 protein [Bacteroidia bacterium]